MESLIPLLTDWTWWLAVSLVLVGLLLIVRFGPPLLKLRRSSPAPDASDRKPTEAPPIPQSLLLRAQPLLTQTEATFYNLIRLAVQEQFLVFAQVPVWCLVEVLAGEPGARSTLLNQIAFKRVQFVLVHPGTLQVARVVELDDPAEPSPRRDARERLLDAVFQRARIPVVRLNARHEYTVAVLAGLLGVEPDDSDG